MTEPCDLSAVEARRLIAEKLLSPVELVDSAIKRIDRVNGAVNAVVATDFDRARATAREAEKAVTAGKPLGLLHGLPVGVKDLEATEGLRTTYGSKLYDDHVPVADQGSVARVRAAGGIVLAKTNTPEFGAGANTRNLVYGATGNAFDPVKTCGGSSGGAAVSLACGMVSLATGSDYGGSLRTPAGFSGVVGFRPSPGIVPSEGRAVGLNPYSVLGPMGRSVADAHLLLTAQTAHDARDPFSSAVDPALMAPLAPADLSSVRVAISEDLGVAPVSKDIREIFRQRTAMFRHVFAKAQDRDPGIGEDAHQVFEITRGVNFVAAHHDRVNLHADELSPNVVDNTSRGMEVTAKQMGWALVEQANIRRRYISLFDDIDVLICPIAAVTPFPHEIWYVDIIDGQAMPTYMRWLALSYALTMATPPVVALPCGVDHLGMPFGIQIAGKPGDDRRVLEIAHALERVLQAAPPTARPLPDLDELEG